METPRVVVGALVYNDNNEIFLAKSHKWKDKWVVPGGHLELGEALIDCVRREVKEETNLDIEEIELLGVQESIFPKDYNKRKHMVFLDYIAKVTNSDVKLNDELQEHRWYNPKEALDLDLSKFTRCFIERLIKKWQK